MSISLRKGHLHQQTIKEMRQKSTAKTICANSAAQLLSHPMSKVNTEREENQARTKEKNDHISRVKVPQYVCVSLCIYLYTSVGWNRSS